MNGIELIGWAAAAAAAIIIVGIALAVAVAIIRGAAKGVNK